MPTWGKPLVDASYSTLDAVQPDTDSRTVHTPPGGDADAVGTVNVPGVGTGRHRRRGVDVTASTAVAVAGYGTIGRRVADAVEAQPDMHVAGVAKRSPDHAAVSAVERGYRLYAADPDRVDAFAGDGGTGGDRRDGAADPAGPGGVAGTLPDLLDAADAVVDATPAGVGAQNRVLYEEHGLPVVYQGGEDADTAATSFVARANYAAAAGAPSTRVVSCNTTGLARLFAPLAETFGVESATVTLVRRGGDLGQTDRGPIDDIVPDPPAIPSHHGPDVRTVLPDVDVTTMALRVPTTLMHVHAVAARLEAEPGRAAVLDLLADESRLALVADGLGLGSPGALRERALDRGRPRGDLPENQIWAASVDVDGPDLRLFQAIHQVADVVPETVDAVRAVTNTADAVESRRRTDEALGIGSGTGTRA